MPYKDRDLKNQRQREGYYRLRQNPEWLEKFRAKGRAASKKYYATDYGWGHIKFLRRRGVLKNKYGLTLEQYEALSAAQEHRCKICRVHRDDATFGKLAVDHDHDTGEIRALLCQACNLALGQIERNYPLKERMVAYLEAFGGAELWQA